MVTYPSFHQEWRTCQKLLDVNTLHAAVQKFDINTLDRGIAKRSKELLSKYTYQEIQLVNAAAAAFYKWVKKYHSSVLQFLLKWTTCSNF